MNIQFGNNTWVEPEELCTDKGQFRRKFRAIHRDTRRVVKGKAAIPDTFFSIPATTNEQHGFLTNSDGILEFYPHVDQTQSPADFRKSYKQQCK